MNRKLRLSTPLETLNSVLSGGFQVGKFCELWGETGGGKSTFAYQTAAQALDRGDVQEVHVLDTEDALDENRLEFVFGLKEDRRSQKASDETLDEFYERVKQPAFVRHIVPTLEKSFDALEEIIDASKKSGRSILCIWDTMSACPTENEFDSKDNKFAGGMMERPRVIKGRLNRLIQRMSEVPVWVFVINQIIVEPTPWGARKIVPGGNSLQHLKHYSLQFSRDKDIRDDDKHRTIYGLRHVSITKSRFDPEIKDIPMVVDVQAGGKIDADYSLFMSAEELKLIRGTGNGWYEFEGLPKKARRETLTSNKEIMVTLAAMVRDHYRSLYGLIDFNFKQSGQ
jgi:RecA/RadA recombinase